MCGIVAVFESTGLKTGKEDIARRLDMIRYRGPDDSGIYMDDYVGLGHVRLSIQDLSSLAAQPMLSHDHSCVLAYNGEIYNVKELQTDLKGKGVTLRSTGDTEALLEYLVHFGIEKTLHTIQGMFAFVLWDKKHKTLIAARDRHGIKPLYYRRCSNGQLWLASELKAIAGPDYEPDLTTLNAALMGLGATWGEPTVFKNVKHVCAGEWMEFNAACNSRRHCYFHMNDFINQEYHNKLNQLRTDEVVECVHQEMKMSTESQLLSDAPVAAFVSGGVDSSLIASLAKNKYPGLQLYHCNVNSESETVAAQHLADSLGQELHVVSASDRDILENTAIATYHYESPLHYHNGSCVPFYLLSKKAGADGIKVILTGEGSDEYFLGYPNIAVRPYIQTLQKIGLGLQRGFHKIPRVGDFLWQKRELLPSEQLRDLMFRYELHQRRGEAAERLHFIGNKTERDFRVLCIDMVIGNVSTLLQRNDRLGMAGGLESRFPFLSENIAGLAVNLASRYKIRKTLRCSDWRHAFISDKWVVREIAGKYLPLSLAFRRKYGFQCSVYRRLKVLPEFYQNGFVQEYYGMTNKAIGHLLERAPERWKESIFSLELWGLIFPLQQKIDSVQEHINQYTQII